MICQALHNVDLSPFFSVAILNRLCFLHGRPQNSIIVIPLQQELTILTLRSCRWCARAAIGLFLCFSFADSAAAQAFRYSISGDIADDLILAQTDPESDEKTDSDTDPESDETFATEEKELSSPRVSLGFDTASLLLYTLPVEIEFHVLPKFSLAIPYQRSPKVAFSGLGVYDGGAGPAGSEHIFEGENAEVDGEFSDFYRQEFGLRATYYFDGLWHGKTTEHLSVAVTRESLNSTYTQTLNPTLAKPIQAAMAAAGYRPGDPGYDNITALVDRSALVRLPDLVYKGGFSRTKLSITFGQRTQGELYYRRMEFGLVIKGDYTSSWETKIPNSDFVYRETNDDIDFPIVKVPFKFGLTIGAAF